MDNKFDYQNSLNKFHLWLKDVQQHEVKDLITRFVGGEQVIKQFAKLSEEHLESYREYLFRDLKHLFNNQLYYNDLAWSEFKESIWFELIEISDKSQLEWQALLVDFNHNGIYHQGEWIGIGELTCKDCNEKMRYLHPSKISACENCGGIYFNRQALSP